jgi:pimeloyl-ACP methyl ester carboxylesterase
LDRQPGTTITLSDSRSLAYAEYGDPHGLPVFFFHGTPGSRFFRPADEITRKMGVRLITADRPGYGLSTFQPGRRILDWPSDIAELADHLGINRFAVAGHSGGGPYVMACAVALPGRVSAAALAAAAGPVDATAATLGMSLVNKLGFKFGRYAPWPVFRLLIWLIYDKRRADPAASMDRENGRRPAADDLQLLQPAVRAACIESETEAFRPGMRGFAWDARLITRDWGFKLDKVLAPVTVWHGSADDLTSTAMARCMADGIPNAHLRLCENEAHLLLFPHWEEILTQLTSE